MALPPYRFRPGVDPRPGEGHLSYDEPFEAGVDLYHQGYLWEAHEAWEEAYHRGRDRDFLKGLIQLAAGLLKSHLGNERGLRKLFARSRGYLEKARSRRGVDVPAVLAQMDRFLATRDWADAPRIGGSPPREN